MVKSRIIYSPIFGCFIDYYCDDYFFVAFAIDLQKRIIFPIFGITCLEKMNIYLSYAQLYKYDIKKHIVINNQKLRQLKKFLILIIITISIVFHCPSIAYGQTNNDNINAKNKNWISVSYMKCLENKLPCECQKQELHSLIRLDSNYADVYNGIIYDPAGGNLLNAGNNTYQVYYTKYVTNLYKDSIIVLGTIQIVGDTLFYIDSTKTSFINYGSSKGGQWEYNKEHIRLLDKAFVKRGYPVLEQILNSQSLNCNCNPELDVINLISADKKVWILEQKGGNLLIYEWTNISDTKIQNLIIKKKLFKTFKWQ